MYCCSIEISQCSVDSARERWFMIKISTTFAISPSCFPDLWVEIGYEWNQSRLWKSNFKVREIDSSCILDLNFGWFIDLSGNWVNTCWFYSRQTTLCGTHWYGRADRMLGCIAIKYSHPINCRFRHTYNANDASALNEGTAATKEAEDEDN